MTCERFAAYHLFGATNGQDMEMRMTSRKPRNARLRPLALGFCTLNMWLSRPTRRKTVDTTLHMLTVTHISNPVFSVARSMYYTRPIRRLSCLSGFKIGNTNAPGPSELHR